jgi:hypothetical protein
LSHLNRGENFNGKAIDAPTSFFTGVAVNPIADDPDEELDRFRRKLEAGARFAMTQIVFDVGQVEAFLERLGGSSPVPVIAGVFPLTSYRLACGPQRVPDRRADSLQEAPATVWAYAKSASPTRGRWPPSGRAARGLRRRAVQAAAVVLELSTRRALAGRDWPVAPASLLHHVCRNAVPASRARPGGEQRQLHPPVGVDRRPARIRADGPVPSPSARPVAARPGGIESRPGSESSGPFSG